MRVAVIGGSGFVGGYLVDALIHSGHEPHLLVRAGSEQKLSQAKQCKIITGSLSDQDAVARTIQDCDAVIYNVGILRELRRQGVTFEETQYRGVVNAVDVSQKAGIKHFVLMSANGIDPAVTPYQDSKYRAEEYLRKSGIPFTIFRPSVIFGEPQGKMEIATQLYRDMVRIPVPALGFFNGFRPSKGAVMMSPVHVQDVADAFIGSLGNRFTLNKTYSLGGPEEISWVDIIKRIAQAVNKRKIIFPMPIAFMRFAATIFDWLPFFPVTRDQLTMLAAGNTASDQSLRLLIDREPIPFEPKALAYLRH